MRSLPVAAAVPVAGPAALVNPRPALAFGVSQASYPTAANGSPACLQRARDILEQSPAAASNRPTR